MSSLTGRSWRIGHVILSMLLISGLVASQDCTYSDDDILASETLCSHNGYRDRHQAPPLIYNASMAAAAKAYTTQCIFEHPPLPNQGSNLAAGFGNPYDAIDAFYNEINDPGYDFDNPSPKEGTLHFTQMVWVASTQIGCGASLCDGQNDVPGWYVICYYYPEGNVVLYGNEGYFFGQNVLRNTSAATPSRFNCPAPPSSCPSTTSSIASSTPMTSYSSIISDTPVTSQITSDATVQPDEIGSTPVATESSQAGSTITALTSIVSFDSTSGTAAPVVPVSNPFGPFFNSSPTSTASVSLTMTSLTSGISTTNTQSSVSTSSTFSSPNTIRPPSSIGATSSPTTVSTTGSSSPTSGTGTTNRAPTSLAILPVTTSSSSTVAAATPIQVAFLLPNASKGRKRQNTALQYLAANGAITSNQNQALTVNIVGNQLYIGNSPFSTNPGTANQIFQPVSPAGSISTSFGVSNNALQWTNSAFTVNGNSQAQFAVLSSTLYAAFSSLPPGATPVQLTAVPAPTNGGSGGVATGGNLRFNTIVTTVAGLPSQTVIQAGQPTLISSNGIIFNVNPTGGRPSQIAAVGTLPACQNIAPVVAKIGGGAINVIDPNNFART